jgi:hypothetical protein
MRAIGLILTLIGGLMLGYRGFEWSVRSAEAPQANQRDGASETWRHLPPVVGGIALVSGLLVLASSGRREET